jgi:hypothetical protein
MRKLKKKKLAVRRSTTMVENPDWRPDRDGAPGFPRRIRAIVNPRESAVDTLFARRFLGMAQKRAAEKFREVWEAAGGTVAGLDYSQDRVDGARGEPITSRLQAAQELRRCRLLLGQRGYDTVHKVCAEGRALAEIAPQKRARLTVADNLRADLDDLATMWGIAVTSNRPAKITGYYTERFNPKEGL